MRIARKLFLLALAVCAMMAFGVSSASAVEVVDEATNNHCATVITEEGGQGCQIEGEATDLEIAGFGLMILCDVHLEGHVSESGQLIANSYDVQPTGDCENLSTSECTGTTAGDRHPSATFTGGQFPHWDIEFRYCLDTALGIVRCHIAGEVEETAEHEYHMTFSHSSPCENIARSLQGEITLIPTDDHPAIEIRD